MLLPRLLTAFVGIPALLFLIHTGSWPFLLAVVGLTAMALREYGLILWLGGRPVQRAALVAGGSILAAAVALGPAGGELVSSAFTALAISGVVMAVVFLELFRRDHSLDRAALTLFGIFFIGWTLPHLALLRDLRPHGEAFAMLLFAVVWSIDTTAYAVGRSMGSRRLAPVVSPKKTWEGAVGGFLAAVIVTLVARAWWMREALGFPQALGLGVSLGVLAQLSDLAESMIKRAVGAKDSSSLLPGHGGVLDRFDSFLLAAPFLYYALIFKR